MTGQTIYHYTGFEALQGILDRKQLWATDVEFLNDKTEGTFGPAKLDELLAMETKARFPLPEALKVFQVAWRSIMRAEPTRLFVSCFCTNGDLLSQWRAYGSYAVGFDRDVLHQLGGQGPIGFFLRDMLYTGAEQQPKVAAIVDQFIAMAPPQIRGVPLGAMNPNDVIRDIMPWAFAYSGDLYQLVYEFKNPAFHEEHEVRAIHPVFPNSTTDIRTRASPQGSTPYVCLGIGGTPETTAIREIVVGPIPHEDEAREAVGDLLKRSGLPDVPVCSSKIPLRW